MNEKVQQNQSLENDFGESNNTSVLLFQNIAKNHQ